MAGRVDDERKKNTKIKNRLEHLTKKNEKKDDVDDGGDVAVVQCETKEENWFVAGELKKNKNKRRTRLTG